MTTTSPISTLSPAQNVGAHSGDYQRPDEACHDQFRKQMSKGTLLCRRALRSFLCSGLLQGRTCRLLDL